MIVFRKDWSKISDAEKRELGFLDIFGQFRFPVVVVTNGLEILVIPKPVSPTIVATIELELVYVHKIKGDDCDD